MKKLSTLLVLVGLVALVAAIPAAAQLSYNGANIEVRFKTTNPFYVGDKVMAPGKYKITQGQGGTLLVKGPGKNEAYAQFISEKSDKVIQKIEVTFNKYGGNEYLNSIKWPGEPNTNESWVFKLKPSAGEEAAAKAAAATAHTISAEGPAATKK